MRRSALLPLTLLLSILGIADSWYLAEHAITNTALSCGIDVGTLSGCNVVAQSPYSHFLGIPLGVYGLVFYGLVFVVTILLYRVQSRRLARFLFLMGIVGALFSFYFEGLQIFVIKAICIYCLGSFIFAVGIFATSLMLARRRPAAPPLM